MAVPVSLIGTFAVMYVAGFSLNNLSLMALTIATGFVVDDAIVVLENVTRHLESGMPRFQAAIVGAREVGFTVMSMSLSLIAVFIPILLMGGILGRLFREFAITLSVAILVSLVISLTATPMMCARVLRQPSASDQARPGLLGRFLAFLMSGYERSLRWALKHSFIMLLVLLATVACNIYLYWTIPKGFFPQQDVGLIVGGVQADQSISFTALKTKLEALTAIVQRDPAVDTVSGFTGGGASAFVFVALKPLSQRDANADQIINRLRRQTAKITGAQLFLNAAQDIRLTGRGSNAQFQYTIQADSLAELRAWTPRITQALMSVPEITDVNLDTQDKGLQTALVYDRDTLSRFGLNVARVDAALYDSFGQRQVSTLFKSLNQYHVVMEVAPDYWQSPAALNGVYVSGNRGAEVPLSAFSRYGSANTALSVNHQGQFVATTLSFNLALGVSLSQASAAIEQAMSKLALPSTVIGSFQGTARVFQESLNNELILILAAFVAVYIVLGILYESYIHPITILSTLPSAGVGALLALILFKHRFRRHRADRPAPADRHREEERHHDDRLRDRRRAWRPAVGFKRPLRCFW